jgi:hypothetical protein
MDGRFRHALRRPGPHRAERPPLGAVVVPAVLVPAGAAMRVAG